MNKKFEGLIDWFVIAFGTLVVCGVIIAGFLFTMNWFIDGIEKNNIAYENYKNGYSM